MNDEPGWVGGWVGEYEGMRRRRRSIAAAWVLTTKLAQCAANTLVGWKQGESVGESSEQTRIHDALY